jgi:hypothetical protein
MGYIGKSLLFLVESIKMSHRLIGDEEVLAHTVDLSVFETYVRIIKTYSIKKKLYMSLKDT